MNLSNCSALLTEVKQVPVFEAKALSKLHTMNTMGVKWKAIIKNWAYLKYYDYYWRPVFITYLKSLLPMSKGLLTKLLLFSLVGANYMSSIF